MDRRALWATVHEVARVGHDLATKQQQVCEMFNGGNEPGLGPF